MGARGISDEELRETVGRLEQAWAAGLRDGEAIASVMRSMNLRTTHSVYDRIRHARDRLQLTPDEGMARAYRYQQPGPHARLDPAEAPLPPAPEGDVHRVLVIPDRHNDPRYPHRLACTTWIARFGSEMRAADVVDLGDACTFDSVSRHAKDDTLKGRLKPGIRDDLSNHLAALQAFERGRDPDWKPRKKKSRGNHEQRLWLYEDANPASAQTHTLGYEEHLAQFGWRERPYGEIFYIGGVGFTHAPFNGLGKPMGGVALGNRAGALLTQSLVHGHTHQRGHYSAKKLGLTDSISVLQCGCALPWGEVEDYAAHNPTGWWWGVVLLTIQGGVITDENWVSMLSLRARYSDDGGDVRAA
jgi:uncharacterized protein YoaH (UPF0181 family)